MGGSEIPYTRFVCGLMENRFNAVVIPYVASQRNRPNVPDRIVWHKYWQGFIEFKGVDTPLRDGQRIMINMLNARCPGSAWVVRAATRNASDAHGYIQKIVGNGLETVAEFKTVLELFQDLRELTRLERIANNA